MWDRLSFISAQGVGFSYGTAQHGTARQFVYSSVPMAPERSHATTPRNWCRFLEAIT
jgi:hypothetical protein